MAFGSYQIHTKTLFQCFSWFSCSYFAAKCCWLWHLTKVPKVKWRKKGCRQLFWRHFLLCCVSLRFQKHDLILGLHQGCFFFILCVLINLLFFQPPLFFFLFLFRRRKLFELFIYFLSDSFWSRTSKRHPRLGDIKARKFTLLWAALGFHINLGRRYTLHWLRLLISQSASKTAAYRIC